MSSQSHRVVLDDFILLNDNIDKEHPLVEEDEFSKAKEMMPMKFMFTLVIICKEGGIRANVNLMDLEVKSNETLLITPGSILANVSIEPDTKMMMMAFANDRNDEALNFAPASLRKYFMHSLVMKGNKQDLEDVTNIYRLMHKTLRREHSEYTKQIILHYLQVLICLFMEQKERFDLEENNKLTRKEEILLDFMQEVHDHCQEHRDLKYYADRLCLSPSYLAHIISETSGKHASEWIKEAVILEAKAMLHRGNYTVQQVSLALNFPNQSFFGKYFKAAVGVSPRQYQLS